MKHLMIVFAMMLAAAPATATAATTCTVEPDSIVLPFTSTFEVEASGLQPNAYYYIFARQGGNSYQKAAVGFGLSNSSGVAVFYLNTERMTPQPLDEGRLQLQVRGPTTLALLSEYDHQLVSSCDVQVIQAFF